MNRHWEDRLSDKEYEKAQRAIRALRRSKKRREDQSTCYDGLTHAGMTAEEADEMINLILEGGD